MASAGFTAIADVAAHAHRLTDSAAGYETSDGQGADRFPGRPEPGTVDGQHRRHPGLASWTTARNTVLMVSTGCHLPADRHPDLG